MGLFSGTCDVPPGSTSYDQRGTAYNTMRWVAIGCTVATGAILFTLKCFHFRTYTRPKEQRQIVRILMAPTVWSVVSLIQIIDYKNAQYYQPFGEFIQYAAPDSHFDGDMFSTVHAADEGDKALNFDWPRLTWIFVFQFPVVNLISTIITEATEVAGTYCNGNFNPKFGYLWAMLIQTLTLGCAIGAIWRFYKRMKQRLRARRGLANLIGFKALVTLMWTQQIIFDTLIDNKVLKVSKTLSYVDLLCGLPNVINCAERVLLACWFWWVCSPNEYSVLKQGTTPYPLWKAIPDSLNPKDWILGIGRMFGVCLHMHRSGGFKQWQRAKKEMKAQKKAEGGSKWSLLSRVRTPKSVGKDGEQVCEESEYRGSYTQLNDSMLLVDRPQKPYDPPRYEQ